MSNLVVIGFDNPADAFELRGALARMQAQYLIEMEDAVVVTRNEKGAVQLHQAVNLTAAGAVSGAFWGSLIGLLFLNPLPPPIAPAEIICISITAGKTSAIPASASVPSRATK